MRRKTPVAHQLYAHLFPHPGPNDPPSFPAHLARNLVPEVRIEVQTFYGDLNSEEARYPGLDYCFAPHRMRLGRFKHHRRLFHAFDELKLTYCEIQDFCCWEGTKWARERYERDGGLKVVDTTGDEIGPFVDRREKQEEMGRRGSITRKTDIEVLVEDRHMIEEGDEDMSDADSEGGEEEEPEGEGAADSAHEDEAYGEHVAQLVRRRDHSISQHELTRRELEQAQRIQARADQGETLSEDEEAFLKEQHERGLLPPTYVGINGLLRRERTSNSGYQRLANNRTSSNPVVSRTPA